MHTLASSKTGNRCDVKAIEELSEYGESVDQEDGKTNFARLINATKEVALVESTSTGLSIIANMAELPPRREHCHF
jgi:hypothetical protein